jgi:hypothetical protein
MSSWILSTVTAQLPGLIEKYEPTIEQSMVKLLTELKAKHPDQVQLFLDNWRKLNKVIERTVSAPAVTPEAAPPPDVVGGKRTRRRRRKHRK